MDVNKELIFFVKIKKKKIFGSGSVGGGGGGVRLGGGVGLVGWVS